MVFFPSRFPFAWVLLRVVLRGFSSLGSQQPSEKLRELILPGCLVPGTVHKILVVTPQGFVRQELKHPKDASFLAFQLLPEEQQLWAASTGVSELYMWSLKDLDQPPQKTYLQDCSEVTCMIRVKRQIWVGGRGLSQGKPEGRST